MTHSSAVLVVLALCTWFAAGLVDWWCHRGSHIEISTGVRESLFHLAQALTVGVALLCALLVRPSLLALVIVTVALLVHTVLGWWDTAYSAPRRHLSLTEQHAHAFLEVLPLAAGAVFVVRHVDAWRAGSMSLEWRLPPASLLDLLWLPAVPGALCALALVEEHLRCRRHSGSAGRRYATQA